MFNYECFIPVLLSFTEGLLKNSFSAIFEKITLIVMIKSDAMIRRTVLNPIARD